ncbi:hypothetical protein D3C71_2165510 [compost metagenome]
MRHLDVFAPLHDKYSVRLLRKGLRIELVVLQDFTAFNGSQPNLRTTHRTDFVLIELHVQRLGGR